MNSIELPEDYVQPTRVVFGQTLLRIALGVILVAHGARRFFSVEQWQDELAARFALLEPGAVAHTLLALEILGGVFLIFGWLTRLGAFALLCSGAGTIALEFMRQGGVIANPIAFELPALLAIAGLFYLLAGGGPASLDLVLRARARRKAIENDRIWTQHPYVAQYAMDDEDTDEIAYTRDSYQRHYAHRRS